MSANNSSAPLKTAEGAAVPEFHRIAKLKLDDLLARGYRITGYAIEKPVQGARPDMGFINAGGLVGWWHSHEIPAAQPADAEVTAYEVGGCSVERVLQRSGAFMWAVRRDGRVLNKQGKWEYEPQPSSRTDDLLERCRFDTARAAINAAKAAAQEGGNAAKEV